MSNLKIVGREPRGSRDISTLSSLDKLNDRLVKQSELSGITSSHFGNLDVVTNAEYTSYAAPFANSANVTNEFSQYISKEDPELIRLDAQGRVPRNFFQQNIITRATIVTQGVGFSDQPSRNSAGEFHVATMTLPSLPYETIPLIFGTFLFSRLGVPASVTLQVTLGTSSETVISAGSNPKLQTGGSAALPGNYSISMRPINLQRARLAAGMTHEIRLSMGLSAPQSQGHYVEGLLGVSSARPETGWTIIRIPSGSGV